MGTKVFQVSLLNLIHLHLLHFVSGSSFISDFRKAHFRNVSGRNCAKSPTEDGPGNSSIWGGCASKTQNSILIKVQKKKEKINFDEWFLIYWTMFCSFMILEKKVYENYIVGAVH